jgi:hypothetical protein
MPKPQINFRITPEAKKLIDRLVKHFTDEATGRKATQAEIIERAVRALAARENVK